MKQILGLLILAVFTESCGNQKEPSSTDQVNWSKRKAQQQLPESLTHGTSYLSVYSQIYSQTEHRTHDLTVTVSMRNTNLKDTIYIERAEYFDTHGKSIRTYFEDAIFITPLETVEIVIDEADRDGGTGGNFIFEWRTAIESNEPLFEGIMISTSGQQGLSFTTEGKRIK